MLKRSKARALALKFLFARDLGGGGSRADFERFVIHQDKRGLVVEFARKLVAGVIQNRRAIDDVLRGLAKNWSVQRMSVVDRNVLRLGAYEILYTPETPVRVIINEGVELSKRYGSAESGGFVNGLLDRIKRPAASPGDDPDRKAATRENSTPPIPEEAPPCSES